MSADAVPLISRNAAIRQLREAIIRLVEECSHCERAAHGEECLGFRGYTEDELRRLFVLGLRSRREARPEELTVYEARWELAVAIIRRVSASCPDSAAGRARCGGWDGFPNEELEGLSARLLGRTVRIQS